MHDVVAHSLAVVIAQADGARFAAAHPTRGGRRRARHDRGRRPRRARRRARAARRAPPRRGRARRSPCSTTSTGCSTSVRAAGLDVRFAETGERARARHRATRSRSTASRRRASRTRCATATPSAPVDLRLRLGRRRRRPRASSNAMRPDAAAAESHGTPARHPGHARARAARRRQLTRRARATTGMFRVRARIPAQRGAARMSGIRVALVDDQALFRAGVRMLVESQPDLEFVGRGGRRRRGVDLAARARPDVMLMDVRMPLLDGIAATERDPRRRRPRRAHAAAHPRAHHLRPRRERGTRDPGGASGFVLKDADPEFLLAAIRTVHRATQVIAATATRELFAHVGRGQRPPPGARGVVGAHPARARDLRARRARPVERRDRGVRVPHRGDREDARQPHPRASSACATACSSWSSPTSTTSATDRRSVILRG